MLRAPYRLRLPLIGLWVGACLWPLAMAGVARAEPASNVVVLRSADASTSTELSEAVDAALLRDLSAIAGIDQPVVSPVDYVEVQLNLGCSEESRACFESIAATLGVSAVVLRTLRATSDGGRRLELRYFVLGSRDEPAVVSAQVGAEADAELVAQVPVLVRQLFGIPEVAPAAAPVEPPPPKPVPIASDDEGPSLVLPVVTIGVGAALLATGIVVGALAQHDFDAWKKSPVGSTEQAADADAEYGALEDRALIANVLMPAGAVVLAAGGTWLALELSSDDAPGGAQARVALVPTAGGLALAASGRFGAPF